MDHYYEIQILPDPEFKSTVLMNALFSKLHRALVQLASNDIGISFPDYDLNARTLGKMLRIHSTLQSLTKLQEIDWLKGMYDHVQVSSIKPIPPTNKFAAFKRIQAKPNVERVRRRQMKRHNLTQDEVMKWIPETPNNHLQLPFLNLKSQSTDQMFKIFIKKDDVHELVLSKFNTYGLSKGATVPLF